MLIKLTDDCYVAADQIAEVRIAEQRSYATVRTKDGVGHHFPAGYGESIYATVDKLIAEINKVGGTA